MRKIILFIATSLDGFIAGPRGEIDWLFTDQDYGYKKFYSSIDTLLMGRKTYELANSFPEWPYAGKKVIVFTHKKGKKDSRVEFSSNPNQVIQKIRKQKGKNAWLVGGGEVVSFFLQQKGIDEMRVFIHPLILGKGIPLFPTRRGENSLSLQKTRKFSSGLVELHYCVMPA